MAATFTWQIANLERNTADGGVTIAHWRLNAVDGEYTASSYGTQSFTPDADADGFVAYDSLTESAVVGWIESAMGAEQVQSMKDSLQSQIDADKNPVSVDGLPW